YPPRLYGEELHPKTEPMEMHRAISDKLLMELVMELDKPLLGICAGMQLINIFFGGKLIQHIDNLDYHFGEKYHPVRIGESHWLKKIFPTRKIITNSNHHQAVDPCHLGRDLTPVAFSPDGGIEALEHSRETMLLGIQWHPERITDLRHRKLIFDFLVAQANKSL
ncbi:MAG TPA: gamma-glutamyl-gamma-aminobutyrate hydrolase family protein, partial [Candidatus Cloacimonadota bacterium]|nr:gamma-glutamyl-gamma-aminobutyrate hydrolase family protein [Candidatus Cloacimonadota bacterium]